MSKLTNPESESSVTCGFFNGTMELSRKYDAHQMSALFDGILRDGIFSSIGECFGVKAGSGNVVNVSPGKAWFNHTWTENDAVLPVDCGSATTGLDRIDAIVIEVNTTDTVLDNFIKVVKGTPSSNPVKPTMVNTDEVHQYALCYIARKSDSESITDADITNVIGTSETPFATGVMETASIDALYAAWGDQFNTWFEDVRNTLNEDAAGALKNQIDSVQSAALSKNCAFELAAEYKTAGTYTWTAPDNCLVKFVIVGAGSGGESGNSSGGGRGGFGGEVVISEILPIKASIPINIVVGAGGRGGYLGVGNDVGTSVVGEAGESSSCMGIVAYGGPMLSNYSATYHYLDRSDAEKGLVNIEDKWYADIDMFAVSPRTSLGTVYYPGFCGTPSHGNGSSTTNYIKSACGLCSNARLPVYPFGYLSAGGGGGGHYNYYATGVGSVLIAGSPGGESIFGGGGAGATAKKITGLNDEETALTTAGSDGANGCGGGGGAGFMTSSHTVKYYHIGAGGRGGDGYVAIYVLKGDIE